jgi:choline dehydrogenase
MMFCGRECGSVSARGDRPFSPDTIVVGSGPSGCAIAAKLAAGSSRNVLLLEAGPDYGAHDSGRWPAELLDYTYMPGESHSWNYRSAGALGTPNLSLERARVMGGCSAHNGCAAVWGHRADFDGWAAHGNPGWDAESILPFFISANATMHVRPANDNEITPWHRACVAAGPGAGFPILPTINDFDADLGITFGEINVAQGIRWNSGFAYLDPLRSAPNLVIVGDTLVDRVIVENGRAVGVDVITPAGPERIDAPEIILAGGAYGSPLVLLRSGIGNVAELTALEIPVVLDLPGVGENLQDHTASNIGFDGTPELVAAMDAFVAGGGIAREEGTIVLAKSSLCETAFDLHLYPIGSRSRGGGWVFAIYTAIMTPKSRGSVKLSARDPEALPIIDHQYFGDEAGADLAVLIEGLEFARALGNSEPLRSLAGAESSPTAGLRDRDSLKTYLRVNSTHDFHPAGSCKMGPASDPEAVVDHTGKVHGIDGLYVGDVSIMPEVTRANTNIPAAVIGERIAAFLL